MHNNFDIIPIMINGAEAGRRPQIPFSKGVQTVRDMAQKHSLAPIVPLGVVFGELVDGGSMNPVLEKCGFNVDAYRKGSASLDTIHELNMYASPSPIGQEAENAFSLAQKLAIQDGSVVVETHHLLIAIAKMGGIPKTTKGKFIAPQTIIDAINEIGSTQAA